MFVHMPRKSPHRREYLDALIRAIGHIKLAVRVERDAMRQAELALSLAGRAPRFDEKAQRLAPLTAVRAVKLFLAPVTACFLPSSGRLAARSGVEFPDLPGGTGQVGVIH
jgi:hypothetical protein